MPTGRMKPPPGAGLGVAKKDTVPSVVADTSKKNDTLPSNLGLGVPEEKDPEVAKAIEEKQVGARMKVVEGTLPMEKIQGEKKAPDGKGERVPLLRTIGASAKSSDGGK